MKLKRRDFVGLAASACGSAIAWGGVKGGMPRISPVADDPEIGKAYPGWRAGEMDLHFVYTGRGENMFYIFPDGTTMVNDTGDYYRTREIPEIPWQPERNLLGGEVMARYLSRLVKSRHIDYVAISHWHSDHIGEPSIGYRLAKDGRRVCGLALLGETYSFGKYFDHQYPRMGQYGSGDENSIAMMREFLKVKTAEGMKCEHFRPGALDQIRLMHDERNVYRGMFSVRNVCANAVCWTGEGERTFDHGAVHSRVIGREYIPNQNTLSMGFVVTYGKFRYWTGGDVSGLLKDKDGKAYNYEAVVGRQVGPVTVCKTNHHAWKDAMTREFVEQVRAAAYVTAVWCPRHIQDCNMRHISSRELYPGERFVFPTFVPEWPRTEWPDAPWWRDIVPGGGHVVVKVAPGGDTYRIYQLESADESMRVKAVFAGIS